VGIAFLQACSPLTKRIIGNAHLTFNLVYVLSTKKENWRKGLGRKLSKKWRKDSGEKFSKNRSVLAQGLYFSTHVTIEESTIYPTAEQALTCLRVCQMLSNCFRDIQLFRFNARTGEVYIIAGDELEIIVSRNGLWRFL
jgi:hypothetical protein